MKITVSQLRKIIKEEVQKVVREAAAPTSIRDIEDKILDIVGYGEAEDYETTAKIVSKHLKLRSTVSSAELSDVGYAGVSDPDDVFDELLEDLQSSRWVEAESPTVKDVIAAAEGIMREFGLDDLGEDEWGY